MADKKKADIPRAPRKPPALKTKQFAVRLLPQEYELLEKVANYLYLTGRIDRKSKNDALRFALHFLAGAIAYSVQNTEQERG